MIRKWMGGLISIGDGPRPNPSMKLNRPFNASPPPRPPSDLYLTDLKPYSLTLSDVGSQPKVTPFRNSCGGMNSRRDYRSNRTALFDGIEEGGTRAYSSHEIDEHENERAIDGLQDRVNILKRLTGDIHEEVDSHNRVLDRMGNDMDASRGVLSGTMDRFKMVFETKSTRRMATLVASFVALFLFIYYLTK